MIPHLRVKVRAAVRVVRTGPHVLVFVSSDELPQPVSAFVHDQPNHRRAVALARRRQTHSAANTVHRDRAASQLRSEDRRQAGESIDAGADWWSNSQGLIVDLWLG